MSLTLNFRMRHNLSVHVCFMRVKNVSGALETGDYKEEPQKSSKSPKSV
jgi:hypothetical protein